MTQGMHLLKFVLQWKIHQHVVIWNFGPRSNLLNSCGLLL